MVHLWINFQFSRISVLNPGYFSCHITHIARFIAKFKGEASVFLESVTAIFICIQNRYILLWEILQGCFYRKLCRFCNIVFHCRRRCFPVNPGHFGCYGFFFVMNVFIRKCIIAILCKCMALVSDHRISRRNLQGRSNILIGPRCYGIFYLRFLKDLRTVFIIIKSCTADVLVITFVIAIGFYSFYLNISCRHRLF